MVCLSEWKSFFEWAAEHGEGEEYLAKAENAAVARQKFDAHIDSVFKILDIDHSGQLTMAEMERVFGEEAHKFWDDMDGEIRV